MSVGARALKWQIHRAYAYPWELVIFEPWDEGVPPPAQWEQVIFEPWDEGVPPPSQWEQVIFEPWSS